MSARLRVVVLVVVLAAGAFALGLFGNPMERVAALSAAASGHGDAAEGAARPPSAPQDSAVEAARSVTLDPTGNLDTFAKRDPAALAHGQAGAAAQRYLGTPASGKTWHSGAWVGGWMSGERATKWGTWRGAPSDVTPTFPEWDTWKHLEESTWHIDTYAPFDGVLLYGLPLLPREATADQLKDVIAGKHDASFAKVARDLRSRGRGDAVVRIGWEANGTWMSFSVTAATAGDYRDAFRRVATVMREQAPNLAFSFDINCGTILQGQSGRLDSLTALYPGDDVVDLVGCSAYDWSVLGATTDKEWARALQPPLAVGLEDVAQFARLHGKGLAVPEWGLADTKLEGHGDNPFFITAMHDFFVANADVLVLESYFNESDNGQRSSLWPEKPENPKAAAEYRRLWGEPDKR